MSFADTYRSKHIADASHSRRMIAKELVTNVKSCTVAIGLVESGGNAPLELWGTGFLVSSKGYVMTAAHVSDRCIQAIQKYEAAGKSVERAVFFIRRDEQDKLHFYAAAIEARVFRPYFAQKPEGFAMPQDIDIAVFNITPKIPLPYLEIRSPSQFELYEDIAICSYPAGFQSLNLSSAYIGARLSPVIQFGKIVGFLPTDDSPIPNGIQTDIIATGGTSGAPIIDSNGMVAGIALQVMKAGVIDGNEPTHFATNVGLAYGLSTNLLKTFVDNLDNFFEKGQEDIPIPFETTVFGKFEFKRL